MKLIRSNWPIFIVAALALIIVISGCAHQPATVTLPPGAFTPADAQINSVLQAGHAAADQYIKDRSSGFTPSIPLALVMSKLIHSLNVADPIYQAYHETLKANLSAPEPQQLVTVIKDIQTAMNNIATINK